MASRNRELLKSALLILGSFAFAYNASTVLHELGHAIGHWIGGGTVGRLIIHPLSWSYCIPESMSEYSNLTTWGGVVFGSVMGLLLVTVVWRWRGPYVVFAFMTGAVACLHNGFYLIFDFLTNSGGDATDLISGGTPSVLILAVGFLTLGIGSVLAGMCLRLIGIRLSDGVTSRMLVLGGGLAPYLLATSLYQWLYNAEELRMWLAKGVSIIIIILLLLAILSALVQRRVRWFRHAGAKRVTWPAVILANLCAFVILSVILILLGCYKARTTTRYILSYYDHQSNLAGIKLKITRNFTAAPGKQYECESVIFWNWQRRKERTEIPNMASFATICPDTNEVIVQTIRGVLSVPMDRKPHHWVFRQEGLLLHSRRAVSRDGCKVTVYGLDPNSRKYVLIALDVSNGRTTKFEIAETPWEMIFIDQTTAVASVGENLIKVEFTESGDHRFSVEPGAGKKGEVKGLYEGEFVFHSPTFWTEENADQHVIECGDMKVPFTDPVSFVSASESYIWAIDINGQVYRVNPDGSKVHIGKYAPDEMIGCGVLPDSLWIAFSDGTVRIFGDSEGSAKIELP